MKVSRARRSGIFGLAVLACSAIAGAANAQQPQRLTRQESKAAPDGALVVNRNATLGNMVVDQYSDFGRKFAAATEAGRKGIGAGVKMVHCDSAMGRITTDLMKPELKAMSKDQRALLKKRDPASLTALSINLLAALDKVDANAIRADEAIGPGVYHDAITGLNLALDVCKWADRNA
jgi:hypothetical protein